MITVSQLRKTYKSVVAVDKLSFSVPTGSLFSLLGTNGAGKTTTISCMTTLLGFDSGEVLINGLDVTTQGHQIREQIGVVFQQSLLDPRLTASENLVFKANLYGLARSRVDELVELTNLTKFLKRPYGVLSGGEKRRVDIARALLNSPNTLFLDEPTSGLDPQNRSQIWQVITDLRHELGITVVLTTHYMEETEISDRVVILESGKTIAEGTPIELRARYSTPKLLIRPVAGAELKVTAVIDAHLPGGTWHSEGGAIHAPIPDSKTGLQILNDLGDSVQDFQVVQGSMDDVFLNLTGDED